MLECSYPPFFCSTAQRVEPLDRFLLKSEIFYCATNNPQTNSRELVSGENSDFDTVFIAGHFDALQAYC